MLFMSEVETVLKLAIWSGYLDDENPVSVLVIADVSEGKSAVLEQFSDCPNVLVINQMTRAGIMEELKEEVERRRIAKAAGNPIGLDAPTHLIIPDLSQILLGNPAYVGETKSTIMALTAEGLGRVRTMYTDVDFRNKLGRKLNCGVLTSVARHDFRDKRRKLASIGFTSRFVPFSYSFNVETKYTIFKKLLSGPASGVIKLGLPSERQHVDLYSNIAELLAADRAYIERRISAAQGEAEWSTDGDRESAKAALREELMPRRADHLRTMVKACALANGRHSVTDDDVKEVLQLQRWMNEDGFRELG